MGTPRSLLCGEKEEWLLRFANSHEMGYLQEAAAILTLSF